LEAALGRLEYANRTRTGPFQNADPGTTKRSTGFVSVTAVLFDDGAEVGRVTATDEFEVTVVHTGDRSRPVNLKVGGQGGRTNVFDIGDDPGTALPGTSGTNRVTLRNDGTRDGVLELRSVEYTSYENGLTGPEAKVDNTGGDPGLGAGELEDALELRASLAFDDGSSRYVIGNASSYRTVASLADVSVPLGELPARESVDLVVEFRVPATTGNEIQSDTIVVDFEFRLVEAD
jgi:hypothetical protein